MVCCSMVWCGGHSDGAGVRSPRPSGPRSTHRQLRDPLYALGRRAPGAPPLGACQAHVLPRLPLCIIPTSAATPSLLLPSQSYSGGIVDGKRHGEGTYQYGNAYFKYEGSWVAGEKHGRGQFTMRDGSVYDGDFVHGEIEGRGTRTWPDGSTYTGEFRLGEFHGDGRLVSSLGDVYEGQWQDNRRHGQGNLVQADGTT
jgi:hypothetical protein